MSVPDPRAAMIAFNQSLIDDFRANRGQATIGPFAGRQLLLLTTVGAKSGESRVSPLAYSRDGDHLVIVASKGGSDSHPAWYLNLVANPVVTVEVGPERYRARAHSAQGAERERLYAQHAELFPNFRDYARKTSRIIPVIVLERLPDGGAATQG